MANSIDERIEKLQERLKQQKAKAEAQIARLQAAKTKKSRADETRKKILLGALILKKFENDAELEKTTKIELDSFLVRDDDRALFGLEPLQRSEPETDQHPEPETETEPETEPAAGHWSPYSGS